MVGSVDSSLPPIPCMQYGLAFFVLQEERNRISFRNTKIRYNILFVVLNGAVVGLYIFLAHNVGHPAWFFILYILLVFLSTVIQVR